MILTGNDCEAGLMKAKAGLCFVDTIINNL